MLRIRTFVRPAFYFFACTALCLTACTKSDPGVVYPSLKVDLKNGSTVYGSATIGKKSDGNASMAISLAPVGQSTGATFKSNIVSVTGGSEALYALLTDVSGNGAVSTTDPIKNPLSNLPIPYDTIVSKSGYKIRLSTIPGGSTWAEGTLP